MKRIFSYLFVLSAIVSCGKPGKQAVPAREDEVLAGYNPDTVVYQGVRCYVASVDGDRACVVTGAEVPGHDLLPIADTLRLSEAISIDYLLEQGGASPRRWAALIGGETVFLYEGDDIVGVGKAVATPVSSPAPSPRHSLSDIRDVIEDKWKCQVMAEDFVARQAISPGSTKFGGGAVHEPISSNSVKVLGKFTTKNAYGVELEYHYRIKMRFNGGDWADNANWEVLSFEYE